MGCHHHGHTHDDEGCAQDLDKDPIRIPGSPFWNVFKRFGRDEMIALAISTVGTTIIALFAVPVAVLAFVGPVIEKVGFFPAHIKEALGFYRSAPKEHRRNLWFYLRRALKNSAVSLIEDVLIHDPLYIILFLILSLYPGIPVWLIATFSFLAAVVAVAWLEVTWHEVRYRLFQRKARRAGFKKGSYLESRFLLNLTSSSAKEIVEKLQIGLKLTPNEKRVYHDTYFRNELPSFSGRYPVLRLRERTLGNCDSPTVSDKEHLQEVQRMQTIQMVYSRPQEEQEKQHDQFRFFPIRKEKFYFYLNYPMPEKMADIKEAKVREILRAGELSKQIIFHRTVMRDESKELLVTVDTPLNDETCCVIELKVYDNAYLLIHAMRFVMTEFPATQTTIPKSELAFFG